MLEYGVGDGQMNKNVPYAIAAVAIIAVAAAVAGAYYMGGYGGAATTTIAGSMLSTVQGGQTTQYTTAPATVQNATLFNTTQYYPYSYLISGGANLSASPATSDFTLSSANGTGGNVTYTISFKGTSSAYNITMGKGDSLYYIDMAPADDGPADHSTGDDGYAVVDPTGHMISLKYPING